MNKIAIGISIGIVGLAGVIIFLASNNGYFKGESALQDNYEIAQKWQLPDALNEVSAIEWLDENRIACVQDEDGIIFIYNLKDSKIEREIRFGQGADYEGLGIDGNTAYVLRSDGAVTEIEDFQGKNPSTTQYDTALTQIKNLDMEGLCVDKKNDRLLLAAKSNDEVSTDFKAIYAFSLQTKELSPQPVFKLQMKDTHLKEIDEDLEKRLNPSEIEIHPKTGELYILDGKNPKLVVADKDANLKELYFLDKDEFVQPEGLTFHPDGTLYISNEGGKGTANILQVNLKEQTN